jgi:hypothetical protein
MPENTAARALGQIIEVLEPLDAEKRNRVMELVHTYFASEPAPAKRPYNRKPKEPTLPLTEAK